MIASSSEPALHSARLPLPRTSSARPDTYLTPTPPHLHMHPPTQSHHRTLYSRRKPCMETRAFVDAASPCAGGCVLVHRRGDAYCASARWPLDHILCLSSHAWLHPSQRMIMSCCRRPGLRRQEVDKYAMARAVCVQSFARIDCAVSPGVGCAAHRRQASVVAPSRESAPQSTNLRMR